MSFLYIGTFGSFIGYSAAMPLLIKLNFWVPEPAPLGTGIYFAYYAFLGALVGSLTRPFGGWLADRYGGARVTLAPFVAMIVWHPRGAVDARRSSPPTRPPTRRWRRANAAWFPLVPRLLPLRLRRHRHRQRLDVQDDPRDLCEGPAERADRAGHAGAGGRPDRGHPAGVRRDRRHRCGRCAWAASSSRSPSPRRGSTTR